MAKSLITLKVSQLVASAVLVLLLTCTKVGFVAALEGPYAAFSWTPATSTFYGGNSGQGTMGGACGYGNLFNTGYGLATTALSPVLFNEGLSCGACFQIRCNFEGGYSSRWCHPNGGSITVTGTNLCPANWARSDGWCNPPNTHFDLSVPAFMQLADTVAGIIPVFYRRVTCIRSGGVRFQINGNNWFNLVLPFNVGGPGNVVALAIKGDKTPWYPMKQNWGAFWEDHHNLVGQDLSFMVTVSTGGTMIFSDVTGSEWSHNQVFGSMENFKELF